MRRSVVLVVCLALIACGGKKGASSSKEVRIAAAADLARAFEELAPAFEKATGIKAVVTPGSTGLLAKQIAEKAPFDLFAAANVSYVDEVVKAGACDGASQALYARGRLVVWSLGDGVPKDFAELADPRFKKIGIANPDHAPYGKAAKQALQKAGIWDQVKDRLVLGENVQVPMQWAKAGEVDASIVALSLAVVADGGSSIPVDMALHDPLDQAMVVCGTGPGVEAAKKFQAFVGSAEGREIMTRYGFLLPGETAPEGKGGTGGDRDGSGSGSAAAPVKIAHLDDAAIRALVDAWLAAQNADDFDKYQTYYAERFTGIKRVGGRMWKFDRKGWFADRGKMFTAKAPMKITLADVKVTPVGKMAMVRFEQTFLQARFKDTGQKQLVVVETKDGLKIASEEMLVSTMVGAPGASDAIAYSIVHDQAGAWMLLDVTDDADTRGKPQDGGGGDGFGYSTHTELALKSNLVGKTVTVYPGGDECAIAEVSVMSMLTPHFGTQMEWSGDEDGDGEREGPGLDEDEQVAEVASGGAQYIAAKLGCGSMATLGVLEKSGENWMSGDGELEAMAQALFEELPEFRDTQAEWIDQGQTGNWSEGEDATTSVNAWFVSEGDASIVVVSARAGAGCGGFYGDLTAVFVGDRQKVKFLAFIGEAPTVAVDVNEDGLPELAGPTTIYTRSGDVYVEVSTVDLGYRDCPC